MYLLVSHVVYQSGVPIYGPIHVVESFLRKRRKKYDLLTMPLDLQGMYEYSHGKKKALSEKSHHTSMLFKFLYDAYFVGKHAFSYFPKKGDVVIAANPLNVLPFALLRAFSSFKLVYYSVDFSDRRFENSLLNFIYWVCDRFSLLMCDENWCVSQTIILKRDEQGFREKTKFVPNVPVLEFPMQKQTSRQKKQLIYVGRMDKNMNLHLLLKAVIKLQKKEANLVLTLVGDGVLRSDIEKLEKKYSFIRFLGPQPNESVIREVRRSGVGLALYDGGNNWNRYGDSMKLREYQYFGLPVITTSVPANYNEVESYDCGVVLNEKSMKVADIMKGIQRIWEKYNFFTTNANRLAKERNKEVILEGLLFG